MTVSAERLAQYAPFALAVALFAAGWMLIVRPAAAESTRAAREAETLRARLDAIRASMTQPSSEPLIEDPLVAFERAIPATDSTARLLEQLARMASAASATNLLIETGEQTTVAQAGQAAPQVAGASPDARLTMFGVPLAYSPVSMSFDADYTRVGDLLWRMRNLATAVEIRATEIKPRVGTDDREGLPRSDGRVHVTMTLFAYARTTAPAAAAGTGPSPSPGVSP